MVRPNKEGGEKVNGAAWHSLVAKGETMKLGRLLKPVFRFDVGQFEDCFEYTSIVDFWVTHQGKEHF